MAKPSNVPLIPLSVEKFDSLRQRSDVAYRAGATPVLGEDFDDPEESYAYAGHCDKFNLSDEDDRLKYAELSAKLYAGSEFMRLWEERLPENGNITVFVSYIRVMKVLRTGNDRFNLEEKKNAR